MESTRAMLTFFIGCSNKEPSDMHGDE